MVEFPQAAENHKMYTPLSLLYVSKARKRRSIKNFTKFSGLIASPETISGQFTMPASENISISIDRSVLANTISVNVSDQKTFLNPALASGVLFSLGYIEKGKFLEFTLSGGAVGGVVSLFVKDLSGRYKKVANT